MLYGIPNATAKCLEDEAQWPCGATATLRLYNLLKDSPLSCERLENSSETPLARCRNSQFDIAEQTSMSAIMKILSTENVRPWRDDYCTGSQYPQSKFNPILDLLYANSDSVIDALAIQLSQSDT